MTPAIRTPLLAAAALIGLGLTIPAQAQQDSMSFFVTSVGKGNGADLGGLAGADAHCQALAQAVGSTKIFFGSNAVSWASQVSASFGVTEVPIEVGLPQRAFQGVPADILAQAARLLPRPS
jgi:hypothetical protein